LLAKYKSNRPSFFRRKFCMVLSYSFGKMPQSFLLQSQQKNHPAEYAPSDVRPNVWGI
jgi:hypothetical protein